MMNKIGVVLDNIGPSQLAFYTINQFNLFSKKIHDIDCCIFTQNICTPVLQPHCAVMNISESMSFDGDLISCSFEFADKLIKSVNKSKKHFHVWSLEWLINPYLYEKYINILRNQELSLSTRSMSYATAIEKYSGVKIDNITPNFNIKKIIHGNK